jgi:hypothetical protein
MTEEVRGVRMAGADPGGEPPPEHELSDPPVPEPSARGAALGRSWVEDLLPGSLPEWALVRQRIDATEVVDVRQAVRREIDPFMAGIGAETRVCVAVGSRGIDRIDQVVRAVVERIREAGASVFLVPAMGSHGGATAEGQLRLLSAYGITPEAMGCEIRSSMDTVPLGEVHPGVPVFIDRQAFEHADIIIPINRVKPHTDFTGEIESGLSKMISIGLGKQRGADTFHRQGFAIFHELIPAVAALVLARAPIPFGLALIENGHARLSHIEAVPAAQIAERERQLLRIARDAMARIPMAELDVLVLDLIGKDISGLGMDSNVVGRYYSGPTGVPPAIQRIIVRDLTEETDGNAVGIGMGDVVLRRAVERMDPAKTHVNCVTAKTPEGARVPLTVDSDRQAFAVAIACCLRVTPETARIVRVRDTKHLEHLYVSAPLLPGLLAGGAVEVVDPAHPIRFDADGMLTELMP